METDLVQQSSLTPAPVAEMPPRAAGRADAVVVAHDSRPELERWLRSIVAAVGATGGCAIVVDNASSDGSADVAERLGAQALRLPRNVGYAAAVNAGAERSTAPYLAIVNPDVALPSRDSLRRLVDHLDRHGDAAAAAPRLMEADGTVQPSVRTAPSLAMILARQTPLGRTPWGRRQSDRYLRLPPDGLTHSKVEWALGAALVVRRHDFDALGGWDERFFLYFEDVDFCLRLRQAGREVHYVPAVAAFHEYRRGSATRHGSLLRSRVRRAHVASALRFFAKHPRAAVGRAPGAGLG